MSRNRVTGITGLLGRESGTSLKPRRTVRLALQQARVSPVPNASNVPVAVTHDAAIEDRLRVFRVQIAAAGTGPIPVLCYRTDVPVQPSHCTCCCERLIGSDGSFGRCGRCGEAARQALMCSAAA
jgi:hypothetical protein